jgi:hypothetical protein
MCRNIKTLHNFSPPATHDEVRASALQFVRKLSGFTKPSKTNEAVFEHAVDEVTRVARELLDSLVTTAPPRDREVEAAKAKRVPRCGSGHGRRRPKRDRDLHGGRSANRLQLPVVLRAKQPRPPRRAWPAPARGATRVAPTSRRQVISGSPPRDA